MELKHYKNEYYGKEAVILGSGPSLMELGDKGLDHLFAEKITIGCNEIIHFPRKVDYYFIGDAQDSTRGYNSNPQAHNDYKPNRKKFFRDPQYQADFATIPKGLGGIYYPCGFSPQRLLPDTIDAIPPLWDCYSISFEMMQFALYAGFNRIYLVGHDCDYTRGTFHTKEVKPEVKQHIKKVLHSWKIMEKWVAKHYPNVRVFNINPVKMRQFELFAL